jgi:CBS domain containing-hemolysin-like protein
MLALLLFTCLAVLAVSFLCSLSEAILLSLNPLALKVQGKQQGSNSAAARWLSMKNHIERPVSAILVFNTIANTGLASFAGALFARVAGDEWLWLFAAVMCVAVLFAGELTPKLLGVHYAERLAPRLITPLTWMVLLCRPMISVMEKFAHYLKPKRNGSHRDQIMDIITLVQAARAERLLHSREEIILIHAATLSARPVKTAQVPRPAVRVFHQGASLHENISRLGPKLHRSYPVSADGTLDRIVGYIRVRELFVQNLAAPDGADWATLIRPVLYIGEKASITQLLTLFLEKHEIASLVTDRAGNVSGWITMDDVMKVLMGARV